MVLSLWRSTTQVENSWEPKGIQKSMRLQCETKTKQIYVSHALIDQVLLVLYRLAVCEIPTLNTSLIELKKYLYIHIKGKINTFLLPCFIDVIIFLSTNTCRAQLCGMHDTPEIIYLLCHFLEGTTTMFMSLYSGHSACNLGQRVLTLNLLSCDFRPFFLITPKFLCPCVAKISLCLCVNHLSYVHAPLRKGQGCHLIPAALLSYLCVSYSRLLAVSLLSYPSNTFYPHPANNVDIKRSFTSAENAATNKVWTTYLFICLGNKLDRLKVISDTICISQIF